MNKSTGHVLPMMMLIGIVTQLDRNVVNVILEPLKKEFSLTDAQAGLCSRRFDEPVLRIFERAYCSAYFASLSRPLSTRRRITSSASAAEYCFWISFLCSARVAYGRADSRFSA